MSMPILCRFITRTQRPAEYQAIMVVKVSLKVRLFHSLFAIMWCSSLSCMLELPPAGVMYDYVIQLYWLWPKKKLNQHYKIWIMPFWWFINVIKLAPENRKRLKLVILRDQICLLDSEIVSVSWSLFMFPWRVRIFIFLENLLHWSISSHLQVKVTISSLF